MPKKEIKKGRPKKTPRKDRVYGAHAKKPKKPKVDDYIRDGVFNVHTKRQIMYLRRALQSKPLEDMTKRELYLLARRMPRLVEELCRLRLIVKTKGLWWEAFK